MLLLGACYNFIRFFICYLIWNGTQVFLQPISSSPLSVISLHYRSVGKMLGFRMGLLILVSSTHSHLAEMTMASFANSFPYTKLLNLLLVKKARAYSKQRNLWVKLEMKNKDQSLESQNGHLNTLIEPKTGDAKMSPKRGLLPSRISPFSRGSGHISRELQCQMSEARAEVQIHS